MTTARSASPLAAFAAFASFAVFAVACRPLSESAPEASTSTSAVAASASAVASSVAPSDGTPCADDGDCTDGLVCFFVNPGCEARARDGACRPATWSHECAVNRPMCGCDARTLRGTPCAGIIRERWSSTDRCACTSDADCKNGQQCFFTEAGCDRAGSCDDPAPAKCPAGAATLCTCKGKTQALTCAQTMREPWSKASACAK